MRRDVARHEEIMQVLRSISARMDRLDTFLADSQPVPVPVRPRRLADILPFKRPA